MYLPLMKTFSKKLKLTSNIFFASRSLVQPYTLEKYMKDKISSKLEEKRTKRVQVQAKLPNVNKDLFMKLKDLETTKKKAKAANLVRIIVHKKSFVLETFFRVNRI
jgi:deoxyribodipyrimidine photolyase-like uncharacterized protein